MKTTRTLNTLIHLPPVHSIRGEGHRPEAELSGDLRRAADGPNARWCDGSKPLIFPSR